MKVENKEEQKTFKYEVYVSCLGTEYFNDADEAWDYIGSGSFGALYEVRDPKDDSLYAEFIPF